MGLIDDDKNYIIDKKETLLAMEFIADALNQNESLAKGIRSLSDMLSGLDIPDKAKKLISDMKMDIDICHIYMKESKAKMINLTKNQLPF